MSRGTPLWRATYPADALNVACEYTDEYIAVDLQHVLRGYALLLETYHVNGTRSSARCVGDSQKFCCWPAHVKSGGPRQRLSQTHHVGIGNNREKRLERG